MTYGKGFEFYSNQLQQLYLTRKTNKKNMQF